MARQYLFIGPGRYRVTGDYMTRQFRIEGGLQWAVHCGERVAGASSPVEETGGLWRPFEFVITVPANCGLVASLQLETATPADAALGARGRVSFDAFNLQRLD
jgi:hypothetical protein